MESNTVSEATATTTAPYEDDLPPLEDVNSNGGLDFGGSLEDFLKKLGATIVEVEQRAKCGCLKCVSKTPEYLFIQISKLFQKRIISVCEEFVNFPQKEIPGLFTLEAIMLLQTHDLKELRELDTISRDILVKKLPDLRESRRRMDEEVKKRMGLA